MVTATSHKGDVLQADMELVFAHLSDDHHDKVLYEPVDYLKMMRMLRGSTRWGTRPTVRRWSSPRSWPALSPSRSLLTRGKRREGSEECSDETTCGSHRDRLGNAAGCRDRAGVETRAGWRVGSGLHLALRCQQLPHEDCRGGPQLGRIRRGRGSGRVEATRAAHAFRRGSGEEGGRPIPASSMHRSIQRASACIWAAARGSRTSIASRR